MGLKRLLLEGVLTHRRRESKLKDGYVILFTDDNSNTGYGEHVWILQTELPYIEDVQEVIDFAKEWYDVDEDEAINLLNPDDIVDTAKAWDDEEFVSYLWQEMEMGQIKEYTGFRTENGAVVIDKDNVEMKYHKAKNKWD